MEPGLEAMVRELYDPKGRQPWKGQWTLSLERAGKGKQATLALYVEEDAFIDGPLYRVLARWPKRLSRQGRLDSFAAAFKAELDRRSPPPAPRPEKPSKPRKHRR